MPTYLLTWNPRRWIWQDFLAARETTARGEPYDIEWRCGNRQARPGDRIFMMQQGPDGRGIFAAGHVTAVPVQRPHFDPERKSRRMRAFVPVRLQEILSVDVDPVIPPERLAKPDLAAANWATRQSGIRLADDVAASLERLWASALEPLRRAGLYRRGAA